MDKTAKMGAMVKTEPLELQGNKVKMVRMDRTAETAKTVKMDRTELRDRQVLNQLFKPPKCCA